MQRAMGSFVVSLFGVGLVACAEAPAQEEAPIPEETSVGVGWRELGMVPFDPAAMTAEAGASAAAPAGPLSREALAMALRPVVQKPDGKHYIAAEPAWAAADAALALGSATIERDPPALSPGHPRLDGAAPLIWGSDDRVIPGNTAVAPHHGNVRIEAYADYSGTQYLGHCTGAYIGPWTVITSAKCLRLQSGGIAQRLVFQPARQGNTLPFGQFDCRNGDPSWNNDFAAAIPAGYASSQLESLNFAVIDTYPCHAAPRWFPGYVVNAPDSSFSTYAYPFYCTGAPAVNTHLCGMTQSAWSYYWTLESYFIDTQDAGTGAAWYQPDTQRVAGTDVGLRIYHDTGRCGFNACQRNSARRIDAEYDSFIKQFSYDF